MNVNNPYENRWRWWYHAIADLMISNPELKQHEIAAQLKKNPNTISMIVRTDAFRDVLAKRRQEWEARLDQGLRNRLAKVASSSLDLLIDAIDKKRDSIPIARVQEISMSALDRLGFSPDRGPQVSVQTNVQPGTVQVAVSVDALAEAREAIRIAQQKRLETPEPAAGPLIEGAALHSTGDMEDEDAPLTISTE